MTVDHMIWTRKGHELDKGYDFICKTLHECEEVIIYGAGEQGLRLADDLFMLFGCRTKAFLDKNVCKKSETIRGIPVVDPSDLKRIRNNGEPVIIAAGYYIVQPRLMLSEMIKQGLQEWKDFFVADRLRKLRGLYEDDFLRFELIEIPITERCTLNCRKCGFFTPYYEHPKDIPVDTLKENVDLLFQRIDYVDTLRFLGGEPFLHEGFFELLKYCKDKYRDRFHEILILSNGTYPISEEILKLMSNDERFAVWITDYTTVVDYSKRLQEQICRMDKYNIRHYCEDVGEWNDLSFPEVREAFTSDEQVKDRFDGCEMNCRTLYDGKLWYCSYESSGFRAGLTEAYEWIDHIDLEKTDDKKIIFEFLCGFTESGSNTLCRFCRMGDCKINGGEQMKKERR